jgi:acetate---CoA ligase (ADP-forming)
VTVCVTRRPPRKALCVDAGGTLARVHLRAYFEPHSIALIGASADPLSISARPLRMLVQHGYPGRLYPINPKYSELQAMRVFPSIGAVPEPVDLALVAVPAPAVVPVLKECAAAGVRFAVVLSSGFAEAGPDGRRLQAEIADVVARTGLRVNGPNAEGLYYPAARLCATFSPALDPEHGFPTPAATPAEAGPIGVVSQSGGLGFAILNHGRELGLKFGAVVSTGNEVDLGWLDYAGYLLEQPEIRVILGFVEGFRRADRLDSVADKAAQLRKPIIVAKIGRSQAAADAAASHTGSDVGNDQQYTAAFRRLGIIRVDDVDEMLDLAAYFTIGRLPVGRRLGVLTTSGGAGAWLVDACATRGFVIPPPDAHEQAEIKSFIPSYGCTRNPVDITAQAVFGGGFERALGILLRAPNFDVVAGVGSMVREDRFLSSLPELRAAVAGVDKAVTFYSYTRPSQAVIAALADLGIPCYTTPVRAARALAAAAGYAEFIRHGRIVQRGVD